MPTFYGFLLGFFMLFTPPTFATYLVETRQFTKGWMEYVS